MWVVLNLLYLLVLVAMLIKNMNRKNNIKGQSLFEVVLALFIITMIIVAVVVLSTNSIANSLFSRSKNQGSRYTQEAIEWLRSQRETNYADFVVYASSAVYCLDTLSFNNPGSCSSSEYISGTNLVRQLNFSQTLESGKKVTTATVIAYWNDSKGYHETRSVTDFTDIRQKEE